jgi:hypothetical protein
LRRIRLLHHLPSYGDPLTGCLSCVDLTLNTVGIASIPLLLGRVVGLGHRREQFVVLLIRLLLTRLYVCLGLVD